MRIDKKKIEEVVIPSKEIPIYVCEICGKKFDRLSLCEKDEKRCKNRQDFLEFKPKPKFEVGDIVKLHHVETYARILDVKLAEYYREEGFYWAYTLNQKEEDIYEFHEPNPDNAIINEDCIHLVMKSEEYERRVSEVAKVFSDMKIKPLDFGKINYGPEISFDISGNVIVSMSLDIGISE